MSQLSALTPQQVEELSMVEIAQLILVETKEPLSFLALMDRIAQVKGVDRVELEPYLPQVYTEINLDGRFVFVGNSLWGLKNWYPIEQFEDVSSAAAPRKKKVVALEDLEDDYEEVYVEDFEEEFEEELEDIDDLDEDLEDEDLEDEDEDIDDFDVEEEEIEDVDLDDDFEEDVEVEFEEEDVSLEELGEEEEELADEEEEDL